MRRATRMACLLVIGLITQAMGQAVPDVGQATVEWRGVLNAHGRYASLQGRSLFITSDKKTNAPPAGCWLTLDPDPGAPMLVCGGLPHAWEVAVVGRHALVCDYTRFLAVYEMTETNWTLAAKLEMPSMTENIIIRSNLAYVASHTGGLTVVDVSDPTKPVIVSNFNPTIDCDAVGLWKDVAVLYGHWESRLVLVDVSDPARPRQTGVYQHDPNTFIQGEMVVDSGFAYCTAGTNGLVIVDVADPDRPKLTKVVDVGDPVLDVDVALGYAFVAAGPGGVHVLDVKNPANPVHVGRYCDAKTITALRLAVDPIRGAGAAPGAPAVGCNIYVANGRGPAMVLVFRAPRR